jgi:peptidyl-prolyl cis-trans isomerase SDCCAG10
MANNGEKDSNMSQFFITLGRRCSIFRINGLLILMLIARTDELHGKHTLFGRVVGDTIYSECHPVTRITLVLKLTYP